MQNSKEAKVKTVHQEIGEKISQAATAGPAPWPPEPDLDCPRWAGVRGAVHANGTHLSPPCN